VTGVVSTGSTTGARSTTGALLDLYEDVPVPLAGEGQVRVKVVAVSVNLSDWECLRGSPVYGDNLALKGGFGEWGGPLGRS